MSAAESECTSTTTVQRRSRLPDSDDVSRLGGTQESRRGRGTYPARPPSAGSDIARKTTDDAWPTERIFGELVQMEANRAPHWLDRCSVPRMTARGRRFLARLVTTLVALAGILTVGALPAAAETVGIGQYVALGDSYAAGQGGGADSYVNDNCLQSTNGYPALLDAEKQIHLRADATCTGATTSDVANEQLSVLKQSTRLVTLTVGAADLGLSAVLAACTAGTPTQCQAAIQSALLLLPASCGDDSELGDRLTDLYAAVAAAAPNALIVVTGYPLLFELVPGDPDLAIKAQINAATTLLNCAIEKAVANAQAAGVNIVYVDVTAAFTGHGIGGTGVPFINPPGTGIEALEAFHPTAAGYVAYAAAISAVLPSSWSSSQRDVA